MTTTAGITVDDCDGSKPKPHVGVLGESRRNDGIPAVTTTATGSDFSFGKQEAVDKVLNDVKNLSVKSEEMLTYLERFSSQASKVLEIKLEDRIKADLVEEKKQQLIEDIASHLKDISVTCLKADHLNRISCQVEKVLEENRVKADLVEERKQQLIEDVASHLKDISTTSLKPDDLKRISFQAKKDDATLLKCQTVLSDFVFFMLSLVPWLLHTHDAKSLPDGYYIRLFVVSALAFLGMVGYLLSHIARGAKWMKAVYCITIASVLSTMALVAFALFSLIPSDYSYYRVVSWIYPIAFAIVGIILVVSWCCNYREIPPEDSDLNIPLV